VAIEVRELGEKKPLISLNADKAMNPASTMKILTTYAALDMLGSTFTWKTVAYLDGELKDGVLYGNLILKGYGDPKLTVEQLWLWLRELRARGLKEIRGDLIADRSFYHLPQHDPAAFDSDPVRAYNVGPDALLINFNTLHIHYIPDGNEIKIFSEPPLDGIKLENRLVAQPTPPSGKLNCDNWDDTIQVQIKAESVTLQGGYPAECGEREYNLSLMSHNRYLEAVFRALWLEVGGTWKGGVRVGVAGAAAQLFATHYSEPLSMTIRDINKFSNNVMARQLFLTLGAPTQDEDLLTSYTSIERSTLSVKNWLANQALDFPELVIENGAGLSRNERISAAHLAQLLHHVAAHPLNAEFVSSLPILGVDGSVKKRLKTSSAASHAHLKTGTLEGVKTLAGYVHSQTGRKWCVVFLINHPKAKSGAAAQDALIEWVAVNN
jgi:D-alanyl-D-alanine carboxypeptidase/D-alanyl-D-alanine-endopeptidase (penicillin-binding protein 4)